MNITVLSGKGGTGKTTISTNLAAYLNIEGYNTQYFDFDVEEPNGFIFLKPTISESLEVMVKVPEIDKNLCTLCGLCAKSCNFNALAATKDRVIVFEKLCHSCGVCSVVCPINAIKEIERKIGTIEKGEINGLKVFQGILDIGEPMGVPIIRKLKNSIKDDCINIIDSPPGSSCNVVNSVEGSDYAILATEPTNFGLHDLEIAVNVVKQMGIPHGVVINKSDDNDQVIEEFCKNKDIKILGKIPFRRDITEKYSRGELLIEIPEVNKVMASVSSYIMEVD